MGIKAHVQELKEMKKYSPSIYRCKEKDQVIFLKRGKKFICCICNCFRLDMRNNKKLGNKK